MFYFSFGLILIGLATSKASNVALLESFVFMFLFPESFHKLQAGMHIYARAAARGKRVQVISLRLLCHVSSLSLSLYLKFAFPGLRG